MPHFGLMDSEEMKPDEAIYYELGYISVEVNVDSQKKNMQLELLLYMIKFVRQQVA